MLALQVPTIADAVHAAADPCAARGDEIVVCRRRQAGDRYRLPRIDRGFDPGGPVDSVSRERHRLLDADGAAPDGTRGSCSAVGASGATGCMIKGWRERDQQRGL